jgi:hypothetical protein
LPEVWRQLKLRDTARARRASKRPRPDHYRHAPLGSPGLPGLHRRDDPLLPDGE